MTKRKSSGTLPVVLFVVVLLLASLACGKPAEEWQMRGWTVTPSVVAQPTQTPVFVKETVVIVAQQTVQVVVQVTPTPVKLCVVAQQAVYLRPSASDTKGYPIMSLPFGKVVAHLGGRQDGFLFVEVDGKRGWVFEKYLGGC